MSEINFTRGVPVINEVRYRKPDGVQEGTNADEEEPLLPNGIELNSTDAPGANLEENDDEHLISASVRIGKSHTKSVDDDDDDVNLRRNII